MNFADSNRRRKEAEMLVPAAHSFAIAALTSLSDDLPDVWLAVPLDLAFHWNFLVTVAGVGVACMTFRDDVPLPEQDALNTFIQDKLDAWNEEGVTALDSFLRYYAMHAQQDRNPPHTVGQWIWENLGEHPDASDDTMEAVKSRRFVQPTGDLMFTVFWEWWKQPSSSQPEDEG